MVQMHSNTACKILGVVKNASATEIRIAWKYQVKRYHPDRPEGNAEKLILVNQAYELLAEQLKGRAKTTPVPRKSKGGSKTQPMPNKRQNGLRSQSGAAQVLDEERAICTSKLKATRKQRAFAAAMQMNNGFYVDPSDLHVSDTSEGEHIATKIEIDSRWILFIVDAPMKAGENAVALPIGNNSAVISFQAEQDGGGRIPISEAVRQAHFPWVEKVEIAFRAV